MSNVSNKKSSKNQGYLKTWDEYSDSVKDKRAPLLLPIIFGIGTDGNIIRERMKAPDVKALYARGRKDIPKDFFKYPKLLPNPDKIVKDYLKYFRSDSDEAPFLPTPLDLHVERPVLMLFGFYHRGWRFTKDNPYNMYSDSDDHTRNIIRIATLHGNRGLMLYNRHYSSPKDMKLDLCVDINQTIRRRRYRTPIIIDPGLGNPGSGFPG